MLKAILRFIDSQSDWTGRIGSVFIFGILGALLFEIFARYLFNSPTDWAHETSAFIFGSYFLLAGAYVLSIRGHVSIDIVYGRLPVRAQAILNLVTFIFLLLMCITLIWWGGQAALRAWQTGETSNSLWQPPTAPIRMMIPIGAFLLLIQGIAKFIRNLNTAITGKNHHA